MGSPAGSMRVVLPARRRRGAWFLAIAGLPVVTVVFTVVRESADLPAFLLLYLLLVVAVAAIGGRWPGLACAVAAFVAANWYFTPPLNTLTVDRSEDVAALVVFVAVAAIVAALVDHAARQEALARAARSEAEALARASATLVADADPLPVLCEQLVAGLGLDGCSVIERTAVGWEVLAGAGVRVPSAPSSGDAVPLGSARFLVVDRGSSMSADPMVLRAVADQAAAALERRRWQQAAAEARDIARADQLRTGLLRSVSHDFRSPLAAIKAYATGLRQHDVAWTRENTDDALAAMVKECDRLDRLVANLLDASRLQADAVAPELKPVALEEVVAAALDSTGVDDGAVTIDVDPGLPYVAADAQLLERVVANLVSNALAWAPPSTPVAVSASDQNGSVVLHVIDHGPGIPPDLRGAVVRPFERLGDRSRDAGTGLGLAIAAGFVTAMNGELMLDDTPGGGLTASVVLPAATIATDR